MHKRWGWMLTLLKGRYFKVKLLYFKEGGKISMQRHYKRNELWLFIFGFGKLTKSDKEHPKVRTSIEIASKGDCFNIPRLMWHQYIAHKPTLVLEIQYGDKCSERDIERIK